MNRDKIKVRQISRYRWEAWSPMVPNARYGMTKRAAIRHIENDIAREWRSGRPSFFQRRPR